MASWKRLKMERMAQGLSQAKLARLADINQTCLCRLEKGHLPMYPAWEERIVDALGYTGDASELMEEVSEEEFMRYAHLIYKGGVQ